MKSKKEFLEKNKIDIIVIFGTLVMYHILRLEVYMAHDFWRNLSIQQDFMLPGIISSITYAILTKNISRAIVVGILTTILWFIWAISWMLAAFTFV